MLTKFLILLSTYTKESKRKQKKKISKGLTTNMVSTSAIFTFFNLLPINLYFLSQTPILRKKA